MTSAKRPLILKRPKLGGAIYIIPNTLTTGNLFFGYFSIVKSMQGNFLWAAVCILIAAVFDVLDGRVARLTRSTSEFGVQYDSLCDLVSFGLAPAILMYQFSLHSVGRIGWIFCFIFLACGALRLARFNVQSSIGKAGGDFTGLPIPMAAGVIACFVGFIVDYDEPDNANFWLIKQLYDFFTVQEVRLGFLLAMAPLLAGFMVSNIRYRSHKTLSFNVIKPFKLLAMSVVFIALVAYKPTLAGFLISVGFALSGPIEWIFGKKATDEDDIFEAPAEEDILEFPEHDEENRNSSKGHSS